MASRVWAPFCSAPVFSRRPEYLDAADAAGATLIRAAEYGPWGARWRTDRSSPPGQGMLYHLCSGASGVGTFLVRLWAHTKDSQTLELVTAAAEAVYQTRWSAGPSVCHGLAGNGEFLLDLSDVLDATDTSAAHYRDWVDDLGAVMFARHTVRAGRVLVPDETGMQVTVDYQVGLAGSIAFLLRLGHGGCRPWTVLA